MEVKVSIIFQAVIDRNVLTTEISSLCFFNCKLVCKGYPILKDKSWVCISDDEIQDDIAMNGISYFSGYFSPSLCELRIQISNLSVVTSYRSNENQIVVLFFRLSIVASLFIVCSCKKMATQRPD